jgi:hypothetical protein
MLPSRDDHMSFANAKKTRWTSRVLLVHAKCNQNLPLHNNKIPHHLSNTLTILKNMPMPNIP